jgi:hypothetical protein
MNLKCKLKQIIEVDYKDFEQLVKDTYGVKEYSFSADHLCSDGENIEFDVPSYCYVNDYSEYSEEMQSKITKMIEENNYQYIAGILLDDLHAKNLIHKGTYFIKVDW